MTAPKSRPRGPAAGYTLIELMFTVVLLGVLMTLAGPRMDTWLRNLRDDSAADRFVADLHVARASAVREGNTVSLRVDSAASYRITVDNTDGTVRRLLVERHLRKEFSGVTLEPAGRIAFDSRGLLRADSTELRVVGANNTETLRISGVGRVYRED